MNFRLALGLIFAVSLSASPSFTLTPSGDISGLPGSTVGWGFTIQNDSGYIEITNSYYCADPFQYPVCDPSEVGTYSDFISTDNDIIVGPPGATDDPSTVSQDFDPGLLTGVGSFAIDPGATVGDQGEIVLIYTLTDVDPSDSPTSITTGLVLSAAASVTVTASSVPEPGTVMLMLGALAGLYCLKKERRKGTHGSTGFSL